MTTFELSISSNYVPDWGITEGVRELIQNAIDGQTDGYSMRYKYIPDSETLFIHNDHAMLSRASLLMGETTKAGDDTMIGENGEGYKLGSLALLRCGKEVSIFNRCADVPEKWTAFISPSKKYGRDVLAFRTSKIYGSSNMNRLTLKVRGITPEEWKECRRIFLDFDGAYQKHDKYNTSRGNVLYGEDVNGHIFVGGIFIQKNDRLWYGYNFKPGTVTLNRDRHMVDHWSLQYQMKLMWEALCRDNAEHVLHVEQMLLNSAEDVVGFDTWGVSTGLVEALVKNFQDKHGENAHPVTQDEEVRALEFHNIKGVTVSPVMAKVLEYKLGSKEIKIQEKMSKPQKTYDWCELNETERKNMFDAMGLVQREDVRPFNVKVMDFNGKDILGQCSGNEIRLARKILSDFQEILMVLVHEYSHVAGSNGDAIFAEMERTLWAKDCY